MKTRNVIIGAATLAVATVTAYAGKLRIATETLSHDQDISSASSKGDDLNGHPQYQNASFAGHNLVNLAMGRPATLDTNDRPTKSWR